jgi:hypothetical protein
VEYSSTYRGEEYIYRWSIAWPGQSAINCSHHTHPHGSQVIILALCAVKSPEFAVGMYLLELDNSKLNVGLDETVFVVSFKKACMY